MKRREFVTAVGTVALLPFQAGARPQRPHGGLVDKPAEQLTNGEYNWYPQRSPGGPIVIIVSIPEQKVHVYRNGIRIAATTCSTGKPGHGTPTGIFKILQKDKNHHSSTYNNAPMPNMNRLTWSGIALHAGNLPGYPASHGCVRLPMEFSELLFSITKLGMTVVIADNESHPTEIVHPGMVLGDYAKQEFAAVDLSIKHYQYSEGHRDTPLSVSVVVSASDRSMIIWENNRIVVSDKVDIIEPQRPIGEHVFTLIEVKGREDSLAWMSSDYSRGGNSVDASNTLLRIKAHPKGLRELQKRMHQGLTLITTDQPSGRRTRSGGGFTIFRAEG